MPPCVLTLAPRYTQTSHCLSAVTHRLSIFLGNVASTKQAHARWSIVLHALKQCAPLMISSRDRKKKNQWIGGGPRPRTPSVRPSEMIEARSTTAMGRASEFASLAILIALDRNSALDS